MAKTVFITGGTGSVGEALVEAFSKSSFQVYFQYNRNRSRAELLAKTHGATAVHLDFLEDLKTVVDPTDVLVNNAAINISRVTTVEVGLSDWERNLRVNLTWPFLLVKHCLPYMIKKGWGRVINVSSIYGLRACEGNLPYNVSKHGLSALTKTVAKEYGGYGITCNEVCPGPIESELLDRIADYHVTTEGISRADYLQTLKNEIPSGRLVSPADVAHTVLFLASAQAKEINGVSIPIDGGLIA